MSKPGKVVVSRGVDHELISGGWRRVEIVRPFAAEDVACLLNAALGEILCVRGAWSWKTGDELAYVRRVLREIGVRRVERRVVGCGAREVVLNYGDRMVVVADEQSSGSSFTLYAVEPWGKPLTSRERRERACAAQREYARAKKWAFPGE